MTHAQIVGRCISTLQQDSTLRRVTAYVSPIETVKATRMYRLDRRERREEFLVSVGRPNYRERKWIKFAKRAGESFPVRKLQLTFWPKRKRK